MLIMSIFFRRQLHIVTEEMTEISIPMLRNTDTEVLKWNLDGCSQQLPEIYLLSVINATICYNIFRCSEIISAHSLVKTPHQYIAVRFTEEETYQFVNETSPFKTISQKSHKGSETITSRDSLKLVLYLAIFIFYADSLVKVITSTIYGENIYEKSKYTWHIRLLHDSSALITEFGELKVIVSSILCTTKFIISQICCATYLTEAVIIRSRHGHINIVVPWYHTMVTDSAYERAANTIVSEVILLTNFNELLEDAKQYPIPFGLKFWSEILHICRLIMNCLYDYSLQNY